MHVIMPALLVTMLTLHVILIFLTVEANWIYHVLVAGLRIVKYVLMTAAARIMITVLLQIVTLLTEAMPRPPRTSMRTRVLTLGMLL